MRYFPDPKEIKHLRRKLGISQKELGEKVDITQSTISRMESGDIDPPYSKVKAIFEFLAMEKLKRKKSKKTAGAIMTEGVIYVSPESKVKKAMELMSANDVSQLPVLEGQRNIGSITSKKIQKLLIEDPELLEVEVNLVKLLPFPEIERDWDIKTISSLLSSYSAVLVKERGKFIGIITDADFLRLP